MVSVATINWIGILANSYNADNAISTNIGYRQNDDTGIYINRILGKDTDTDTGFQI